jgi:putative transposase
MYNYRKLSSAEQESLLLYRRRLNLPLHEPPHYPDGSQVYLITAACFEHQPVINTERRRLDFQNALIRKITDIPDMDLKAWVVLPNHYHVLLRADIASLRRTLTRLHNRIATAWNREDGVIGRKVWYRFTDRRIRNDRHYYASLNYIHANPRKHGYTQNARDWLASSLHIWIEKCGINPLRQLWKDYPVGNYGAGWDD